VLLTLRLKMIILNASLELKIPNRVKCQLSTPFIEKQSKSSTKVNSYPNIGLQELFRVASTD
jgi:hypothetical protein